jgi:hypothetical protein
MTRSIQAVDHLSEGHGFSRAVNIAKKNTGFSR